MNFIESILNLKVIKRCLSYLFYPSSLDQERLNVVFGQIGISLSSLSWLSFVLPAQAINSSFRHMNPPGKIKENI
jgi:hypothetical protein